MSPQRNFIATSLLACLLLLTGLGVQAAPAGQVTNLSGPLFAMDAKGGRRVLSIGSQVEAGETLITEGNTYAQVRFLDQGVITLRPGTQFKVEAFAFDEKAPEKDAASFGLFKGALRAVTGMVGKRGNQDAYKMNTPTATIGIRGTQYIAQFVPEEEAVTTSLIPYALPLLARLDAAWSDTLTDVPVGLFAGPVLQLAQANPGTGSGLAAGLYVHVIDGLIQLSNKGGSMNFSAGQFGYTASVVKPPVVVPTNPGIQFTPPPAFSSSTTPQPGSSSSKPKTVDCEVR